MHEDELPTTPGYYFFESVDGKTSIVECWISVKGDLRVYELNQPASSRDYSCFTPQEKCGTRNEWGRWGRKIDVANERHHPNTVAEVALDREKWKKLANDGLRHQDEANDEAETTETVPLSEYQDLQARLDRLDSAASDLLSRSESFLSCFAVSCPSYRDRKNEERCKFYAYELFAACEQAKDAGLD